jgi:flagellar protein FliO/FliZ
MEAPEYLRSIIALLFVVALILLIGRAARHYGLDKRFGGITMAQDARLKVTERLVVDQRRRLLIVEFEGKEHLVLLGAQQDVVIESREVKKDDA